MPDQQLFEVAVTDAIQVLRLLKQDVFTGPEYTKADESTENASAASTASSSAGAPLDSLEATRGAPPPIHASAQKAAPT
jgi:hypothetical protein